MESQLGQGATFFFTLPASSVCDAPQAGQFALPESTAVRSSTASEVAELSPTADKPMPVPQGVIFAGLPQAGKMSGVDA